MKGGSVIIGEQIIVQDGLTDFNNHEDQASNDENIVWGDYSIGGSSDSSEVEFEFSDSSVKQRAKRINENSTKKSTIPFDEDSEDKSEGC
jgi:hypothetical protein